MACAAFALSLATGCPSAGDKPDATDRVRAGQRYRFVLAGLPKAEQVYEVLEVDPFVVRYTVQASLDGDDVGAPVEMTFSRDPPPAWQGPPGEEVELTIGDLVLSCRLQEEAEGSLTWTVGSAHPEFPGVVKVTEAGESILELVEVTEPE